MSNERGGRRLRLHPLKQEGPRSGTNVREERLKELRLIQGTPGERNYAAAPVTSVAWQNTDKTEAVQ
ncbi:hypothetical protein NDU88_006241 [Pleurodeles waltl]|uniref:Uncharacterized protein n=1 Tax=Pleurodeles waltl TaxID=8319 RepID=A0AAV7WFP8_PLEWA|nr:hypothetical protein NDU88_006241 [Pleurodeles waltl]